MPKVVASAPGKVTLFGEHAIVYGYPAIVSSIDLRVYVTAYPRNDDLIKIIAYDLKTPGLIVTYTGDEIRVTTDYGKSLSAVSYLNKAIRLTADYLGISKGINLEVKSEMPVGAGLGTSAAVSVATVAAYASAHGYKLSKDEISELAWSVEKTVQGIASPMDTSIATYGGYMKIWKSNEIFQRLKLNIKANLPIIIGYVERKFSTGDMVLKVKELRDRYEKLVDDIMKLIGELTNKAEKALISEDLITVGELMNMNQGLLDALGVSDMRLNELVYLAREAGALGSKLTGAGGGGAIIALAPKNEDKVEAVLKTRSSMTLKTKFGVEGVKVTSIN